MEYYGSQINNLIQHLAALPGIGGKTAQRLAFHIVRMPKDQADALAKSITDAREHVRYCKVCGTMTDAEICPICADGKRDHSTIMVVENSRDLAAYEKTGKYSGLNCHGEEKVRRYREVYGDAPIDSFYSDSRSDAPLAGLAAHAYLVHGDERNPWS